MYRKVCSSRSTSTTLHIPYAEVESREREAYRGGECWRLLAAICKVYGRKKRAGGGGGKETGGAGGLFLKRGGGLQERWVVVVEEEVSLYSAAIAETKKEKGKWSKVVFHYRLT